MKIKNEIKKYFTDLQSELQLKSDKEDAKDNPNDDRIDALSERIEIIEQIVDLIGDFETV